MIRLLLLAHRYLGIGAGLLMVMWCLSGFVMMYVSYPALDAATRLAHLAPIDWRKCCRIPSAILADDDPVPPFSIEMLAGRPVLHPETRGTESIGEIDLATGTRLDRISPAAAESVAAAYSSPARGAGGRAAVAHGPRLREEIELDQWTLEGIAPSERPLYRFDLRDRAGSELYVSSASGRAVQLTTRRERLWNRLGAIPHWLYFTDLRRHPRLWSEVVVYTSLIGCFLAGTGLYIGVRQLIRRPRGRWSPYRGFHLWHHLMGLFFGLFVLSWVLSGMLSMNPWGLMESTGAGSERSRLLGAPITGAELRSALQALARAAPAGVVSIRSAPLAGKLFVVTSDATGTRRRLDPNGAPAPLSPEDLSFIADTLHGDTTEVRLLTQGDAYFFSLPGAPVELPIWRVLPKDRSASRYYVDPLSGELIRAVDRGAAHYRWWHDGLHRMDFSAAIRARPQWDVLMWLLMSGVTAVCITGTYLGFRRLTAGERDRTYPPV